MKKNYFALLLTGLVFAGQPLSADTAATFFDRPARPTIFETVAARTPELEALAAQGAGEIPSFVLYEAIIAKLLPKLIDHDVYFFARDMDTTLDALHAVLYHAGIWPEMRSRIRRLNLSRPVSEKAPSAALIPWLASQHFRLADILGSSRKTFLFDNGYRSHAFSRVLFELCHEAARTGQLENFFAKVVPRLIASHGDADFEEVAAAGAQQGVAVCEEFRYWRSNYAIRFPELFTTPEERRAAELSNDQWARIGWLQDNWDRLNRHWTPRVLSLSADGSSSVFDSEREKDARVDRHTVVRTQLAMWDYFSREDVLARLLPHLDVAFDGLSRAPPRTVDATIWRSPGGMVVEIQETLSYGPAAIVHRGILRPQGTPVVLKLSAPSANVDGVAAVESDIRYAARLREVQHRHTLPFHVPEVLEAGPGFVLKSWHPGELASAWLPRWAARGAPGDDPFLLGLGRSIRALTGAGLYVRKLEPAHVSFAAGAVHILHSGGLNDGGPEGATPLAPQEVANRFRKSFLERWGENLDEPCAVQLLRALGLKGDR